MSPGYQGVESREHSLRREVLESGSAFPGKGGGFTRLDLGRRFLCVAAGPAPAPPGHLVDRSLTEAGCGVVARPQAPRSCCVRCCRAKTCSVWGCGSHRAALRTSPWPFLTCLCPSPHLPTGTLLGFQECECVCISSSV